MIIFLIIVLLILIVALMSTIAILDFLAYLLAKYHKPITCSIIMWAVMTLCFTGILQFDQYFEMLSKIIFAAILSIIPAIFYCKLYKNYSIMRDLK